MHHIAHAADQLVIVIVTLSLAAPEMSHLRISCCQGPFSPAVSAVRVPSSGARLHCCLLMLLHALCPAVSRSLGQVPTSTSRFVKLLGDTTCVRSLMLDTCGYNVSFSPSPPPAAVVGVAWGCRDAAAIAGIHGQARATAVASANSPCMSTAARRHDRVYMSQTLGAVSRRQKGEGN